MHPSNVSVSAGLTGVCWCEQGCHLSSLDQKPTRTSAGTIRQGRPASARQMFLFPPRWVGDCGFDWDLAELSGVQKTALIGQHLAKNKSRPSPAFFASFASFASPKPRAIIQGKPTPPTRLFCPLSSVQYTGLVRVARGPILPRHEPHWHINPNTSLWCFHRQDQETICLVPSPGRI